MAIRFTCPHCGKMTDVAEEYLGRSGPCAGCGKTVTVTAGTNPFADRPAVDEFPVEARRDIGDDPAVRLLLPVGRSPWAIAAGYAGLFAVLCFPAPIALVLGLIAIRDIKRHPDRHGMGRAIFAIVMGAFFTILLIVSLIGMSVGG
jgi:hypothetical protein